MKSTKTKKSNVESNKVYPKSVKGDDIVGKKSTKGRGSSKPVDELKDNKKERDKPKLIICTPFNKMFRVWLLMLLKLSLTALFISGVLQVVCPLIGWQIYSGNIPSFMINPNIAFLTWGMNISFFIYGVTFTYTKGRFMKRNVEANGRIFIQLWFYIAIGVIAYLLWQCLQCDDHKLHTDISTAFSYWYVRERDRESVYVCDMHR